MKEMWKRKITSLPVESKGKTSPLCVEKKVSICKAFCPVSTKVFPTTTVTK